jgi:hypothetical protein
VTLAYVGMYRNPSGILRTVRGIKTPDLVVVGLESYRP